MAYVALYRKWRPKDFGDLVGQDHISHTLAQAIKSGKIGHAYLFSGPRGTGKTSTAKILAKALNCEHGPTAKPCNKCSNCKKINSNTFMDVYEIDAASNRGIDEIRDLRETVKFAPTDGKYKVYIIDEVHMLTSEAFNALLKTLEEPPAHVVFILATTEIQKVPATIQSRCQRYDFKRISQTDIKKQLKKITSAMHIEADDEALSLIAVHADGGMRDALSLLDQCSSLSEEKLTAQSVRDILGIVGYQSMQELTDAVGQHNTKKLLQLTEEIFAGGKSISQLLTELAVYWRCLMIYKACGEIPGDYQEDAVLLVKQAKEFQHEQLTAMINDLYGALVQIRWSPQPKVTLEMALLKLCYPYENSAPNNSADSEHFAALEKKINHLENIIAKFSQMGFQPLSAAVAGSPASAPKTEPSAAGAAALNAASVNRTSSLNKKIPSAAKNAQTPPKAAPAHAQAAAALSSASPEQLKDAQTVWNGVLKGLKERHKIPALACVEKAIVCALRNDQLIIAFHAPFLKARTERDDYKNLIEEILLSITGKNIKLICTMDVVPAANAPAPAVVKNTVHKVKSASSAAAVNNAAVNDLSEEEKKRLQKAVNIFGGNIIAEDEK